MSAVPSVSQPHHTLSRPRQDFEDACWSIYAPGEVTFNRDADGAYLDRRVEKHWELWRIAKGIRE